MNVVVLLPVFVILILAMLIIVGIMFDRFHRQDEELVRRTQRVVDIDFGDLREALPKDEVDSSCGSFLEYIREHRYVANFYSGQICFKHRSGSSYQATLAG